MPVSEYSLDERQRSIVRELVRVCEEQKDPGEFVFCAFTTGASFTFKKTLVKVGALPMDAHVLEEQRLITMRWSSQDAGPGCVRKEAFQAVKRNFHRPTGAEYLLTDRQWKLASTLAVVGENYHGDFFWRRPGYGEEAGTVSFQDRDLVLPASKGDIQTLRQYGWISADFMDDGSATCEILAPLFPAARGGFQQPASYPVVHRTTIGSVTQIVHSPGAAVGDYNATHVSASPMTTRVEDVVGQLADQHEAIRIVLQDLVDTVDKRREGWLEKARKLAETAEPFIQLINSLIGSK